MKKVIFLTKDYIPFTETKTLRGLGKPEPLFGREKFRRKVDTKTRKWVKINHT